MVATNSLRRALGARLLIAAAVVACALPPLVPTAAAEEPPPPDLGAALLRAATLAPASHGTFADGQRLDRRSSACPQRLLWQRCVATTAADERHACLRQLLSACG